MCVDCRDTNTGTEVPIGPSGADGSSAFVYLAYADDSLGTGFTMTFDPAKDWVAIKSTTTEIAVPGQADFTGLWKNYKGATGAAGAVGATGPDGPAGTAGTNGVNAYTSLTLDGVFIAGVRYDLTVGSSAWASIGQIIYVQDAGYYRVVDKTSSTNLRVDDLAYTGNNPANLLTGKSVSTAGIQGATGANGVDGADGRVYEATDGSGTPVLATGPYEFLMRKPDNTGYMWINIVQLKELLNTI